MIFLWSFKSRLALGVVERIISMLQDCSHVDYGPYDRRLFRRQSLEELNEGKAAVFQLISDPQGWTQAPASSAFEAHPSEDGVVISK